MKILIIILSIFLFFTSCKVKEPVLHSLEVFSAFNEMTLRGSFFLGCGYIGHEENYFFFVKKPNGGLIRVEIPVQFVEIYEGEYTPHIEWYSPYEPFDPNFHCTLCASRDSFPVKLYVPRNTIIKKFDIK